MSDPLRSYRETQIKTATQGKLIVMLYDGAIKFINLALESMQDGKAKYDSISNHIIKAQDIVTELMVSLDFEKGGEIAKSLFSLYMFINRQLLDANIQKESDPLDTVKKLLIELRSAWVEVSDKKSLDQQSTSPGGVNIAG